MEFFETVSWNVDPAGLAEALSLKRLPEICSDIYEILEIDGEFGRLACVWGTFDVRRSVICCGVRFELTSCPCAMQWTATVHPTETDHVVCHCTIDSPNLDPEFIQSLENFLRRFAEGISHPRRAP